MSIQVDINSVDRTKRIDWQSLKIKNVLTQRVDSCSFIINTYGDQTYVPNLGNVVEIYKDAVKIFAGVILKIRDVPKAYKMLGHVIECVDYTRLLDGKLVTESYENMKANDIIADLMSNWGPVGFTTNNVDANVTIEYISFNYETLSRCLMELAHYLNYDWYVDYDKDIHFFSKETNAAAFDLNDDDGSYIYESLVIRRDNSQVRNVVVVEGGEYLGNTLTSNIDCTGIDWIYNIGYRFENFEATLSATPLSVGIDFSGDPDDYDALWNRDEKVLKFKEVDVPSVGALLKIVGDPYLPVIVKKYNQASIEAMVSAEGGAGEYEYYIFDKRIDSKEGAIERASAELYAYAQTISEADFRTENDGLRSGQQIIINSSARGLVNQKYIINKVTAKMRTSEKMIYQVSLVTTRTYGIVELLQELAAGKNKDKDFRKKILNLIQGADEFITMSDVVTTSKAPNPQSEAIALGETFTAQSLDYDADFVVGPYIWNGEGSGDHKRQFLIGGSVIDSP